jgi:hypothetical protein
MNQVDEKDNDRQVEERLGLEAGWLLRIAAGVRAEHGRAALVG